MLALDFRCLHARQAVEAFRDLDDDGGEPSRVAAPVRAGAKSGFTGRVGDMAYKFGFEASDGIGNACYADSTKAMRTKDATGDVSRSDAI